MNDSSQKGIQYIPYQGERYRDDRMFVFNIVPGKLEKHFKDKVCIEDGFWVIYYRNTIELPLCDKKFFKTRLEAEESVRINEPLIPLISNYEQPYPIFKGEHGWELWDDWLSFRGLHSALSGYQNFTLDVVPNGGSFSIGNKYTDVFIESSLVDS